MSIETTKEAGALPLIFFEAVEPDSWKFDLGRPFWRGGYLAATDGRIAVRTPMPIESAALTGGLIAAKDLGDEGLYPDVGYVIEPAVHLCGATTSTEIPEGLVQYAYSDDQSIERYRGGYCITTTVVRRPTEEPVRLRKDGFGEVHYASYYLAMLRKHGVTELYIPPGDDAFKKPAYFKGDGFEGALMPMDRDRLEVSFKDDE